MHTARSSAAPTNHITMKNNPDNLHVLSFQFIQIISGMFNIYAPQLENVVQANLSSRRLCRKEN